MTWDLMRASGFVLFILLTVTTCLGIANVSRLGRKASTRAVATVIHRNASLLAVVFLAVHVITALLDKYVNIPLLAVLVPGQSVYDPFWTSLGALSLDLTLAVVVTSLLRARIGRRVWRAVHWLSYASWPSALVHGIGSGTGSGVDTGAAWSTIIYIVCGFAFAGAVAFRLLSPSPAAALAPGARSSRRYGSAVPA